MMFVSIDMDNLMFLHCHADHDTLSALSFLEAPDRTIQNENTDRAHFLMSLDLEDLQKLYRNTTSSEPPAPLVPPLEDTRRAHEAFLRELLAGVVTTMKPTLASMVELEAQIACVEDDLYNGVAWSYARGSRKPAKQEQLFRMVAPASTLSAVAQAATAAPQRVIATTPAPVAPKAEAAPSAPHALKQRASSVRPLIWQVADAMWAEAGSPIDVPVVLALRKTMMVELEEKHAVKKTSSSNELGNWMKARLG